jgi:prepilin-type processing-associated H-X9-DG protein
MLSRIINNVLGSLAAQPNGNPLAQSKPFGKRFGMTRKQTEGFALRELVAVLASLGMLIMVAGTTVPQLTRERLIAPCANNIANILAGMAAWAVEHNDMIVGSPSTSGYPLLLPGLDPLNIPPGPCQDWDWAGPLEHLWGMEQPPDVGSRFDQIRYRRQFRCPANRFLAAPYSPYPYSAGVGILQSYNTSRNFMFPGPNGSPRYPENFRWNRSGVGRFNLPFLPEQIPDTYGPFLQNIGDPACKVFVADGARYSTADSYSPEYDLNAQAAWGGAFADSGPYSKHTCSWDRSVGLSPDAAGWVSDARIFGYRHGTVEEGQPLGQYQMNVGFFDGHVVLMDDTVTGSANPHLWLPSGSTLTRDTEGIFPDVLEIWFGGSELLTIGDCPPP